VPIKSPGPLIFKSSSAILKPSVVRFHIKNRAPAFDICRGPISDCFIGSYFIPAFVDPQPSIPLTVTVPGSPPAGLAVIFHSCRLSFIT
jgi:hypothetical protein